MAESRQKVLVAMSGGVDSSVAAALLQRSGHEVVGVTMQLLPCDLPSQTKACCGFESTLDALRVAEQLDIPHHVFDCPEEFSQEVLEVSWREYDRGRTPNPCVLCNQRIRFRRLLDFAEGLGIDRVATGHHARIQFGPTGQPILVRGCDPDKDQSYFLYALTGEQLGRALMPIGDLTKARVREIASELGLTCADRPESQDACFLTGGESFAESLRQRFDQPARPGPILDSEGHEIGRHPGVHLYTIGQRKGLGVALGKPAWVQAIDFEKASLTLTTDPDDLLAAGLLATEARFGPAFVDLEGGPCQVQIRSRHRAAAGGFSRTADGEVRIEFEVPQRAVTPGQAVVFYRGDQVLGGGCIQSPLPVPQNNPGAIDG